MEESCLICGQPFVGNISHICVEDVKDFSPDLAKKWEEEAKNIIVARAVEDMPLMPPLAKNQEPRIIPVTNLLADIEFDLWFAPIEKYVEGRFAE